MKRAICAVLALALLGAACAAPGGSGSGRLRIVTTVFPVYDWVREIAGDAAEVTLLLDNGVDPHSYQPTAADVVRISTCDVFVYIGGADEWTEDALAAAHNGDRVAIDLLEALGDGAKREERREGMQGGEEEEPGYDGHVWLSLRNAAALCGRLSSELGRIDPGSRDVYRANADAYAAKLNALDARYAEAVAAAGVRTLLFADRFPFRYLVDDYGLDYYAAFDGCSAESEASFETVVFLAGKVDELGLSAILQTESADGSVARTVRDSTVRGDQAILTLDSLQSVTREQIAQGKTYLSAMENNLAVLTDALK